MRMHLALFAYLQIVERAFLEKFAIPYEAKKNR